MSVQEKAVRKALSILDLVGARYRVEHGGFVYTPGSEIAEDMPPARRARQTRDFSETGYIDSLKAMKPGDIVQFKRGQFPSIESRAAFISFAGCVMHRARAVYGKDNVVNELRSGEDRGTVTVLRVQ